MAAPAGETAARGRLLQPGEARAADAGALCSVLAAGPGCCQPRVPASFWPLPGDAAVGRGEGDAVPGGDSPLPPCSTEPVPGRVPPGAWAEAGWDPMGLSRYHGPKPAASSGSWHGPARRAGSKGGQRGRRRGCRKPVYFTKTSRKEQALQPSDQTGPLGRRGALLQPQPHAGTRPQALHQHRAPGAGASLSPALGWLLPQERLDGVAGSHGLNEANPWVRDPKGHVHGGAVGMREGGAGQRGQPVFEPGHRVEPLTGSGPPGPRHRPGAGKPSAPGHTGGTSWRQPAPRAASPRG